MISSFSEKAHLILCCSIFESAYMPMEVEEQQVFQIQRGVRY